MTKKGKSKKCNNLIEIPKSSNKPLTKSKNYFSSFLRFNMFSCRHDSFFFLYSFIIYPILKKIKNDPIIDICNKISNTILTSTKKELDKGIWNILSRNKNKFIDLTVERFRKYYTVLQVIQFLKNKPDFFIKYKLIEGWSIIYALKIL